MTVLVDSKPKITPDDIKAIRAARKWSASDLAKRLGCNQSTVWRMENGGNISGPAETILVQLRDNPPGQKPDLERIKEAANWIASEPLTLEERKAIAPVVMDRFSLSDLQAEHAIAEAKLVWARAM